MALTKIPGNLIEAGAITAASLDNDAVTTAKILDANITHAKLHTSMDLTGKTVTVATAASGTNTTAAASTAFVQQELTTLIDGAPGTLDTLNELAAAINDDANYNSTLTTALATKLPLAGGTMTGSLNMGSQNISAINNATAVSFLSTNGYWVGGTRRIDGSGNLENIGTITSSGAVTTPSIDVQQVRILQGTAAAGGIFKERTITGAGVSNDVSIFAESITDGGEIHFMTGGSATKRVTINATGNVGIGTDSPGDISLKVHSNDSDDYIAIFKQNHASNLGTVQIDTPSDSNARPSRLDFARGGVNKWKTGMVYGDSSNGWGLSDATGSGTALQQTRFLVQPGGSVGIGTTSPDGALTVNSTATTGDMIARFQYGSNDNDVKGIRVNAPNVSGTQAYADFAVDPETGNLGIGAGTSSGNLPIGQANMNNAAIVVTSPAGAAGVGEAIDFQPGESHTRTSVREQHHFGASDVNVQFRRFIYAASGFSNPTKNIITFTASGNYPQACVYAKVRQMGVSVNRAVLAEGMISVEKDSGASSWDVDYATMSNGTTGYSDVSTDFWPIARIGTSVKPAWTTSINGNSITIGILCNRSTNYDRYIIEVEMFSHQSMSHSWEA